MKKPVTLSLLFFLCLHSLAQVTINGKVIDADSKEPLTGASVFAQNTTRGTVTDKEGLFKLYLDKGGYELAISFTGYTSKTYVVQGKENEEMTIELRKADNSMSEVVIKSSNEVPDGWEKYGRFFLEHFIGATSFSDSCTLENPQVLKFLYYKRNDRLKILAAEPLVIQNRALGYTLRYELDSFVYFMKKDLNSYRGRCFFSPMEGSPEQQEVWAKNRKAAYQGSRLHFLRSYYDSTLKQEGWRVELLPRPTATRFEMVYNPYDTSYYAYNDSTDDVDLWYPAKISVVYSKKAPEKKYLEQYKLPLTAKTQVSYVDLNDAIVIKPNGYFFDQGSWTNQGYWSWKNLADQLPYDYEPE